jgi:hypothetical protein
MFLPISFPRVERYEMLYFGREDETVFAAALPEVIGDW